LTGKPIEYDFFSAFCSFAPLSLQVIAFFRYNGSIYTVQYPRNVCKCKFSASFGARETVIFDPASLALSHIADPQAARPRDSRHSSFRGKRQRKCAQFYRGALVFAWEDRLYMYSESRRRVSSTLVIRSTTGSNDSSPPSQALEVHASGDWLLVCFSLFSLMILLCFTVLSIAGRGRINYLLV
jgi:hypothetical protein